MEIAHKNENKYTKYNHVAPIDLDTIPEEEKEQALIEFAEGSIGLEKCLRVMWNNNLKTHACCAGNDEIFDEAYIAMAEGVDLFSYLSENLLNEKMIVLEQEERQTIRIAGSEELKEKLLLMIALDITNGKKNNNDLLKEKIGKPFPLEWIKESRRYSMQNEGLSEKEIAFELKGIELNRIMEYGTQEEKEKIMPEYEEYTQQLMEKYMNIKGHK